MRQLFIILFTVLSSFTLFAQGKITGNVIDQSTSQGLDNCIIRVSTLNAPYFSLNGGAFELPLDGGKYNFQISKKGYVTIDQDIELKSGDQLTIKMMPEALFNYDSTFAFSQFTDEVVVEATRASDVTPTTFTTVTKEELNRDNFGQDLPFLLEDQPSVVVTSDAGAGVGYTSMRIRGSDMSRINFTVNGIPYNDPESQGVFLVNMPDFASSISDIQIQRGVGTSTNGAGAFGASVNISTSEKNEKAYAEYSGSVGSFSTFKNTLKLGTGLIKDHFTFDGRLSKITSDGYIDRASANLQSYFISGAYYDENTIIRFNNFSGKEVTYQSWNGTDAATLASDRTFNSAGTDYFQKDTPYDNEVDNYRQDHYQLLVSQYFKSYWTANAALHYTKGSGYFEQYKVNEDFADYGLNAPVIGNDTISSTDLIRRRWLDNDFYGMTFSMNYTKRNKIDFTFGGAWNQYDGDHFGEIVWAQYAGDNDIRTRYYDNNGLKTDANIFLKAVVPVTDKLFFFGDIQYRNVAYTIDGIDNDQRTLFVDKDYSFINPKFGLSYSLDDDQQVYGSFAIANREPTRNDFIDNAADDQPIPETLYDLELGYKYQSSLLTFNTTAYYMGYDNQLVLTGALNDVGSSIRDNVAGSFRTGIETTIGAELGDILALNTNFSWSVNQIKTYIETSPAGILVEHDRTKIAFSPQWVGAFNITVRPAKGFRIDLINKFVGKQFLDNTTNSDVSLNKYTQSDIRLSYTAKAKILKDFEFSLLVNNFMNNLYESNGYVYFGEAYYYPQAGTNFLMGVRTRF